jgi:hypothetical protein
MEIDILKNITLRRKSLVFRKIIYAIDIQREAIKLVRTFKKILRNFL